LGKFGIREMHWHQQSEWAIVTNGTCRITILDELGRAQVGDVGEGDLWFFPPGLPHSLQGVGEDGSEFMLGFDYGLASEFDTLLLTDFMYTMPPEVLSKNFNMPQSNFANIPLSNLWIFQGNDPGPLAQNVADTRSPLGLPPNSFIYPFSKERPLYSSRGGNIKVADSSNFKASTTTAAALLTVHPGGMRELHWHPTADEWQYWMKGKGRMTVFNTGPHSQTMDFHAGDIGYVKKNMGHYIENTGDADLVVLGLFKGPRYYEITLANWIARTPPQMVTDTLNITREMWAQIRKERVGIVPF
jgi:oxalate decarboxylase